LAFGRVIIMQGEHLACIVMEGAGGAGTIIFIATSSCPKVKNNCVLEELEEQDELPLLAWESL
jgi:hypothetical protein